MRDGRSNLVNVIVYTFIISSILSIVTLAGHGLPALLAFMRAFIFIGRWPRPCCGLFRPRVAWFPGSAVLALDYPPQPFAIDVTLLIMQEA